MQIKLRYMGDGSRWIMNIAKRDLTDYDLETYCVRDGIEMDVMIETLTKRGLYAKHEAYTCANCGKDCKSAKALIKHELQHAIKTEVEEVEEDHDNSINGTKETDTGRN